MTDITITELAALTDRVLIDVRERDEYAAGHVPGAVNLPLSELEQRADEVPEADEVYVICQAGGRSARATKFLEGRGVPAINVLGGTGEWIAAGLPVD